MAADNLQLDAISVEDLEDETEEIVNSESADDFKFDAILVEDLEDEIEEVIDLEAAVSDVIGYKGAKLRDNQYTDILATYVRRFPQEQEHYYHMKWGFFWVVVALLGLLVAGSLILFFIAIFNPCLSLEDTIIYVTSSLVSLISSVLVLPKIIAKHLFPEKRENEILDLIKTLIKDDCEIRKATEARILAQNKFLRRKKKK